MTNISRRIYIVANRLPVSYSDEAGFALSPGGLVAALLPVAKDFGATWIGWPGETPLLPPERVEGVELAQVLLSQQEVAGYYLGFANSVLWPLAHGRADLLAEHSASLRQEWWQVYRAVNEKFARVVAARAEHESVVWVQDYHLFLVPALLKELRPDLKVGFFLHTPAISVLDLQRQETAAFVGEIVRGLADSDLIGVQSLRDARDLQSLGITAKIFPISIDPAPYSAAAFASQPAAQNYDAIDSPFTRASFGRGKLFVGVDRLDYAKGILERITAFADYLRTLDKNAGSLPVLAQVLTPTRQSVPAYQALRAEVERLTAAINAEFAEKRGNTGGRNNIADCDTDADWVTATKYRPAEKRGVVQNHRVVQNFYVNFEQSALIQLYRMADVMVISSLRDGMNLVAKEFVASRIDERGVLLLSTHAGVADELGAGDKLGAGAIVFDPLDKDGFVSGLALTAGMSAAEQGRRMQAMRQQIFANTANDWAKRFLASLLGDDL